MTPARLTRLRAEAADAGACPACWIDGALMGRVLSGEAALPGGPLLPCGDGDWRCVAHAGRLSAVAEAALRRWLRLRIAEQRMARLAEAERRAAQRAEPRCEGCPASRRTPAVEGRGDGRLCRSCRHRRQPPHLRGRWLCGACGASREARGDREAPDCGCGETMAWEAA